LQTKTFKILIGLRETVKVKTKKIKAIWRIMIWFMFKAITSDFKRKHKQVWIILKSSHICIKNKNVLILK